MFARTALFGVPMVAMLGLVLAAAWASFGNGGLRSVGATHECPTLPPNTINIRADIDGRSWLIIQDNQFQWQHWDFAAPGRHEDHGVPGLPTYVNCAEWFPSWPDDPTPANRDCGGCLSDTFKPDPAKPSLENFAGLEVVQCRHICQVVEAPTAGNGYRLVIEFDDNPPFFYDWYEVNINLTPTVGGISVDPELGALPLEAQDSSGPSAGVLAGIAAGVAASALGGLGGAAWWVRRRWMR